MDDITSMVKLQNSTNIVGNSTSSSSSKADPKPGNYKLPDDNHQNRSQICKSQRHGKKGKLVEVGINCDVGNSSGHNQVYGSESKCSVKHVIDDSKTCDSSSSVGITDIGLQQGRVYGQVKRQSGPHSGVTYCSSPQNSFYSASQFSETKESFTVSEPRDSGEIRQSYRYSTDSDLSDESSSSSLSSVMYKPHKVNDVRWIAIEQARSRYEELQLNHFRLLKQLGCGDIGKVYLAELVVTRTYFAMKVMNKADLESRKKLVRAKTEREILQSLDHPFLPTLYTQFETENHSCLVMELCSGGDLHSLRQKQPHKFFPEHSARFYAAEILLALEYLHMLGVIYRDLKPENVLMREDGHIMLSDFDLSIRCAVSPTLVTACIQPSCMMQPTCFGPLFLAKKSKRAKKPKPKLYAQGSPLLELLAEPTNARSMSFVGTHEYLAPEIIKGEGHGSAVDWWTFGIFLYELLFGKTPFKGQSNRATLFNVIGQPLKFPETPSVSFAVKDLIRGLLVKDPQHRLAYKRGATEIKQHPFFQSINWALIRCATPPEVPRPFMLSPVLTSGLSEEKVPGLDLSPSGNFLQMDFF